MLVFNLFLENATLFTNTDNFDAEFDAIMADTEATTTDINQYTQNGDIRPEPAQGAPGDAHTGEPVSGNGTLPQEVTGSGIPMPNHGNAPTGIQNGCGTDTKAIGISIIGAPDHSGQGEPGVTGMHESNPTPILQANKQEHDSDVEIIHEVTNPKNVECWECEAKPFGEDLGNRHFYTHVRTIALIRDEPLSTVEFDFPRSLDNFTVHNKFHLGGYKETYNVFEEPPRTTETGRYPYWTHHDFLLKVFSVAEKRLKTKFPFRQMDKSLDRGWTTARLMISYKTEDGEKWFSIPEQNLIRNRISSYTPSPRHEKVRMFTKEAKWVDSILYVYFQVDFKRLSIPRRNLSDREAEFMATIRHTLDSEDDALKIILNLLSAFQQCYRDENTNPSHEKGFEPAPARSLEQIREDEKDLRKATLKRRQVQKVLRHVFTDNRTYYRDGSLRQLSIRDQELSLKEKRKRKKMEKLQKLREEMNSPPCKRSLTFAQTLAAGTANEQEWKKSTNFSQSYPLKAMRPKQHQPQSGGTTQQGPQGPYDAPTVCPRSSTPTRKIRPRLWIPQNQNEVSKTGSNAAVTAKGYQRLNSSQPNQSLKRPTGIYSKNGPSQSGPATTSESAAQSTSQAVSQLSNYNPTKPDTFIRYSPECLEYDQESEYNFKWNRKQAYTMKKKSKKQYKRHAKRLASQ